MEIRIEKAFRLVGIRVEADWRSLGTEMPAVWQELRSRLKEIEYRVDDDLMDVCLQENGEIYTQCVGVEVSRLDSIPEGMTGVEIPAQQVVYHLHTGREDQIAAAFADMYTWAEENGFAGDAFKIDRISSDAPTEHHLFIRVVEQRTGGGQHSHS